MFIVVIQDYADDDCGELVDVEHRFHPVVPGSALTVVCVDISGHERFERQGNETEPAFAYRLQLGAERRCGLRPDAELEQQCVDVRTVDFALVREDRRGHSRIDPLVGLNLDAEFLAVGDLVLRDVGQGHHGGDP